ncbi:MAG: DUF177 domain-containing protein [Cellulosilyticaceae bacterium]
MKIDIHTLITEPTLSFQGTENVSLVGINGAKGKLDCIAKVSGTIIRDKDKYFVSGTVEADLPLVCDRCMNEYIYSIHAELCSEFSSDRQYLEENEDARPVVESCVDLSDDIAQAILIDMPMKLLCKEDCKGLCKVCGRNLNQGLCSCMQDELDPRLEQFKDIFC